MLTLAATAGASDKPVDEVSLNANRNTQEQ